MEHPPQGCQLCKVKYCGQRCFNLGQTAKIKNNCPKKVRCSNFWPFSFFFFFKVNEHIFWASSKRPNWHPCSWAVLFSRPFIAPTRCFAETWVSLPLPNSLMVFNCLILSPSLVPLPRVPGVGVGVGGRICSEEWPEIREKKSTFSIYANRRVVSSTH